MTFFVFPGQGSQRPGMGKDLYDQAPAARAVLDRAAAVLPSGFLAGLFDGDQETLNQTRVAQPALLAVETAITAHLAAVGVQPAGCAGHSLGEISAIVAAGVCSFEDALRFTVERARLMSEDVSEGGMAAVLGLPAEAIEAALPEGVCVANYNGPSQTIISGPREAMDQAAASLKAAGAKRVLPLPVSGPFHSPCMRRAAEQFRDVLRGVPFHAPKVRFISSVSGHEESDPERIRVLLGEQLFSPVRWTQVMQCIGPVPALETGPGSVLQGLAKRMDGAPMLHPAGTWQEIEACAGADPSAEALPHE